MVLLRIWESELRSEGPRIPDARLEKKVIWVPKGANKYLSPAIQNELIEILGQRVKNDILDEIRTASFFSVSMDTTQDIAKIAQMSQVKCIDM